MKEGISRRIAGAGKKVSILVWEVLAKCIDLSPVRISIDRARAILAKSEIKSIARKSFISKVVKREQEGRADLKRGNFATLLIDAYFPHERAMFPI